MKKLLVLMVLAAAPAWAQTGRRALEAGTQRYLLADFQGAIPLLSAGLDPAAALDDRWMRGVQRLADALLVLRQDSLAATWLRWAARVAPDFAVDEEVMPPAVAQAGRAARAYVEATPPDRFGSVTTFEWGTTPRLPAEGAIRLAPANVPLSARIGVDQFVRGGESRRLPPGSYQVVVSAPGYLPSRLTAEVLPGVATIVGVSLLPETAGFVYVTARPWAVLSINGERIGYTPTAGHRVAAAGHALHLERPSGEVQDIPIAVPERGHVRVAWVTKRDATGDPRLDGALAALDSAQTERGVELLRSLLGIQPPLTAGRTLALARLAEAAWSLGERDSARAYLRQLVQTDPFYLLHPDTFNPEFRAAYWAVRRETPAVAIRAPADTVLNPADIVRRLSRPTAGLALPLEVAVGQPGVVRIFLRVSDPRPYDSLLTVLAVDSVAGTGVELVTADGSGLAPGTYTLEGEIATPGGSARDLLQMVVERLAVDTVAHLPPIPPYELEPETEKTLPSPRSIVRGLALGALAVIVPMALNDADLSGRWIAAPAAVIGGSVALASIVSSLPEAPIPENMRANGWRRSRWEEQNRRVAAENAVRLRRAAIRIRIARAP
ncbi:MAG TPA: hypothetical protein VJL31_11530 [Gemmatimonadales bacterium]|nr:hypothetical protein [Gemmatimonadales bacterium]